MRRSIPALQQAICWPRAGGAGARPAQRLSAASQSGLTLTIQRPACLLCAALTICQKSRGLGCITARRTSVCRLGYSQGAADRLSWRHRFKEAAMTDQSAINPYAPPKARLEAWVNPGSVQAFPRFSTWGVLLLGVVTLGIYPLYWLYTRTEILNRTLPSKQIPMGLASAVVVLFIANVAASLVHQIY